MDINPEVQAHIGQCLLRVVTSANRMHADPVVSALLKMDAFREVIAEHDEDPEIRRSGLEIWQQAENSLLSLACAIGGEDLETKEILVRETLQRSLKLPMAEHHA